MTAKDPTVARLGIALVVLLAASPLLPGWAVFLATVSLAKGLVALGLVLLMRTGLVSFGQGLYYALGAYAAGIAPELLGVHDAALMVLAGTVAAALVGLVLGVLLARYRAIFFAMLSLAFSMILYGLLVKSAALGSTDGFNAAARTVAGLALAGSAGRYALFVLASVVAFASTTLLHRYLASHLGRLTPAVKDNELRVEYMGASVRNVVHLNLVLASALAGAGGVIAALAVGHVDPDSTAYWTTSGEFVFVAILSGTGSVAAPFVGALLLELLRSFAYEHAPNTWQLVVGGVMLVVILFLPEGLWSLWRRTGGALGLRPRAPPDASAPASPPPVGGRSPPPPPLARDPNSAAEPRSSSGPPGGPAQPRPAAPPLAGRGGPVTLETSDLTKTFGAVTAANAISVSVEEDTVVGLIGGNGAGKTTFVNLVTGYLRPSRGAVRFAGREITGLPPRQVTRLGICRSFQIPQVFESLSARENLLVGLGVVALGRRAFAAGAADAGRTPEEAADEMLARFRLERWRDARASVLPEGVRKLLDVAMALAVKPRVLLLDEPTSGVSADEKFALMDLVLGAVRADRVTVLFVEHDMEIVRRYAQRVLAFYDGKVIADGPPADVFENADVRRFVVGGAAAAPAREGAC